jgi:diguanylate cyclase (GGDEF)-like protein
MKTLGQATTKKQKFEQAVWQQRSSALLQDLQKTLKFETLIQIFSKSVQQNLPFDSISYMYEPGQIEVNLGASNKHKATYPLTIHQQDLGTLVLTRRNKFRILELKHLEQLVEILHYPIKNAILYHEAIQSSLEDHLTQVGNRKALLASLSKEIKFSKRYNSLLTILMLDIDYFKSLNDQLGHSTGDLVIKHIADILSKSVRDADVVFRYGGDEFIILLRQANIIGATLLANRIQDAANNYLSEFNEQLDPNSHRPSVSIGVAPFLPNDDPLSVFNRVDKALYNAKNNGRNCVTG